VKWPGEEIDLGGGYVLAFEGQFEQERRATQTILLVSILSLIFIYLALHAVFRSSGQAILILLNLPLALVGGLFVVRFGSGVLSIAGLIGFITLFGIAVRNGIILIDQYNELIKEKTMGVRKAVLTGSFNRLQPIMMTVITTALALLPLVITGNQPGNEIQGPDGIRNSGRPGYRNPSEYDRGSAVVRLVSFPGRNRHTAF
jgi:Cu/Ag efflux pump CusA